MDVSIEALSALIRLVDKHATKLKQYPEYKTVATAIAVASASRKRQEEMKKKMVFRVLKDFEVQGRIDGRITTLLLEKGDLLDPTGWERAYTYATTRDIAKYQVKLRSSDEGELYERVYVDD